MFGSRRRRRRRRIALAVGVLAVAAVLGGGWYVRRTKPPLVKTDTPRPGAASVHASSAEKPSRPPETQDVRLAADEVLIPAQRDGAKKPGQSAEQAGVRSEATAVASAPYDEPEAAQAPPVDPTATRTSNDTRTGNRAIEEARQLLERGKLLEARQQLNTLLRGELSASESSEVRALLTRIADDTIFGRQNTPNDPLVDTYTVQAGDVLLIVARQYDVPHEALMLINGIPDPTKIREGQKLKVVRGPFNAKILKSEFRLDVYLQDVYLRSYRVGLGTAGGTPEGVWRVKNRLENPTYYPPASAADKRIIPPDDPNNPLGKRWIGIEGVEGEALGHEGYGIHGTIEPESIGKAVSLGCIRMHNEDVAILYMLMLPGRSSVTILP